MRAFGVAMLMALAGPPVAAAQATVDDAVFVAVAPGSFQMGSSSGPDSEKPARQVTLSHGFEIAKFEVTQAQWEAVTGSNPSRFKGEGRPVEGVSWNDAKAFIRALNAQDPRYEYRLPTEAEWEYAARAGGTGDFAGTGVLAEMGWCEETAGGATHPVGRLEPNAWGLYDMHGNVWEWVQDRFAADYYASAPAIDPPGPSAGDARVVRGGAWSYPVTRCTASARAHPAPDARADFIGFRLVREPR